jgi:hypothetical protein
MGSFHVGDRGFGTVGMGNDWVLARCSRDFRVDGECLIQEIRFVDALARSRMALCRHFHHSSMMYVISGEYLVLRSESSQRNIQTGSR